MVGACKAGRLHFATGDSLEYFPWPIKRSDDSSTPLANDKKWSSSRTMADLLIGSYIINMPGRAEKSEYCCEEQNFSYLKSLVKDNFKEKQATFKVISESMMVYWKHMAINGIIMKRRKMIIHGNCRTFVTTLQNGWNALLFHHSRHV